MTDLSYPTYQKYKEKQKYAYARGVKLHTADGKEIGEAIGTYLSIGQPDRVIITRLFVRPEYRRQGYGRQLVGWLRQLAIEVGANYLQNDTFDRIVYEQPRYPGQVCDDESIRKVYEKLGFYASEKRTRGYRMRMDV